jgi:anti-sigma factor RsiW
MDDLACQELVELVTDFLEGVLGPTETERVNKHLEGCQSCERYIAQVRATIRATAILPPEAPEVSVEQRLADLHRHWLAGRARR